MAWDTPDVYYSPEKFELEPVGEIDFSSGSYEFDIRAAWKHADGRLLTARDAGCSCPSPFEDYTTLESLEPVDVDALRRECDEESTGSWVNVSTADCLEFLAKVRAAEAVALEDKR